MLLKPATLLLLLPLINACGGPAGSGPEKPGPVQNVKGTIAPRETLDLTRQTVVHTVEFAQPKERVWQALLAAHESAGMTLAEIDPAGGTVVYRFNDRSRNIAGQPAADYVDCGMGPIGPRANTYRLNIKLTNRVATTTANMTRFMAQLQATATHPGMSSDIIECSSNGVLEKRIVGFIAAHLN